MTDYIHDEWCASREGPEAPGPCNCYVAVIRRREARIEELERERAQVEQFIRDMYTGRFAKRESDYWMLPQWIRDTIEADPLYKEEA